MPAIGFVTKQQDGSYRGELQTLTIRTGLEIRPVTDKSGEKQPDYRVFAHPDIEIGVAWKKLGQESKAEYVSVALAVPEFGARRIIANLGLAAGQTNKDVFALIWNPEG